MRSDTGAVDFGFDDDLTAANLLSGAWDKYRRVGSVQIVDAGGGKYKVREFKQVGNVFLLEEPVTDYNSVPPSGDTAFVLSVPAGVIVEASVYLKLSASGGACSWAYWDGVIGAAKPSFAKTLADDSSSGYSNTMADNLVTDNNQRVYGNLIAGAAAALSIGLMGWRDQRGRDS
jgi:hypothetical protein